MNLKTLTTFLGWCTIINFALLLLGGLAWVGVKDDASEFAASLFGITADEVKATILRVLLQYRGAIIFLNLVPYIVLKIMKCSTAKTEPDELA